VSSGKYGWADLIGEQTDPDLGQRVDAQARSDDAAAPRPGARPAPSEAPTPLSLPAPDASTLPTVEAPAPAAPGDFSVEDMVDKLQAPPGSGAHAPGPSFWSEWKEVILTASLGTAALAALAFVPWGGNDEPDVEALAADEAPAVPAVPPPTTDPVPRPVTNAEAPEQRTRPAPAPMVSVVSEPPGAMVQLDGVVYGETPLILPAPAGQGTMEVVLRLDGYVTHEGFLEANEAGHFSLNVKLQPRRR